MPSDAKSTFCVQIKTIDFSTFAKNKILAFSALMLLVGWREGHPTCKKLSGGMLA